MSTGLNHLNAENYLSASRLLAILTASAFLIELLVLTVSDLLPSMPTYGKYLLDSIISAALLFPIFYYLVFRPMLTHLARIRQAEENLRIVSIAFESKDPILITDAKANILRANNMFLKITGYTADEIIGKNSRILKPERNHTESHRKMWEQLLRTGSWRGEIRIKGSGGREIPAGAVITAVKDEQQKSTHYVAIYDL